MNKILNIFTALLGFTLLATIEFLKPNGEKGNVDGIPTWSTSRPDLITIIPSDDGYSAKIVSTGAIGTASIMVCADADLGDGVKEIIVTDQVQFIEPMVTTGQIVLSVADTESVISETEAVSGEITIETAPEPEPDPLKAA